MKHPLKGEPLTVLVMPKIIIAEHMFEANDCMFDDMRKFKVGWVIFAPEGRLNMSGKTI